jgi:hypothetical protein
VLFGTAKSRAAIRPAVGLPDDLMHGKERWFVEMFYPLIQSRRTRSSLSPGGWRYAAEDDAGALQRADVAQ